MSQYPTGGTKTRRGENNESMFVINEKRHGAVCPELNSVVMETRHGPNVLKTKSVFNHPPPLTQVDQYGFFND